MPGGLQDIFCRERQTVEDKLYKQGQVLAVDKLFEMVYEFMQSEVRQYRRLRPEMLTRKSRSSTTKERTRDRSRDSSRVRDSSLFKKINAVEESSGSRSTPPTTLSRTPPVTPPKSRTGDSSGDFSSESPGD